TMSGAPSFSEPLWPNVTRTRTPPARSRRGRIATTNTAAARMTPSMMAPTRCCARWSPPGITRLLLPEELPGIALEIADQLAHVDVDVVLREQRAGGALALAQVGDHAVDVVDEAAGLLHGGRGLVGDADRA